MKHYKQPVSVLVVIYTTEREVLLLERADHPGYWQSVTGSRDAEETLVETAIREVREETGLDVRQYALTDWQSKNVYEIYPQWRYRYPPDITYNTEHVFGVVCNIWRIAVSPLRVNLINVFRLPVGQRVLPDIQPGFFAHLAYRRLNQRFFGVTAAGDRLPIAGMIGTLQQQHLPLSGVDHHQHRDRLFVVFHALSKKYPK